MAGGAWGVHVSTWGGGVESGVKGDVEVPKDNVDGVGGEITGKVVEKGAF